MSINHFVPCGNEHRGGELVSLPIWGRVNNAKEVPLFCIVVYKVQGKNAFEVYEKVYSISV